MKLPDERIGSIMIFFEAFLWSLFPILTLLSYKTLSPLFTYSLIMLFSGLTLTLIITLRKKWHELREWSAIKYTLISTFFIGFLFYFLIFIGLKYTTSGNASIVALMEIFFSYIIFNLWYKEKQKGLHLLGAFLMVFGALFILFPGKILFNKGDILILIATIFPPIGNYFSQKARKIISSEMMLFLRTMVVGIIFTALSFMFSTTPSFSDFNNALPWILISSIFLFTISKILWIEGIHRIPVTKAISLSTISPVFTLFFAYLIFHDVPTLWQVLGFIPMAIGVFLILKK